MTGTTRIDHLIGKPCRWTPTGSDQIGVNARIVDAVLTAARGLLVLVAPNDGHGGTWVLGDEVWCDGRRLAAEGLAVGTILDIV